MCITDDWLEGGGDFDPDVPRMPQFLQIPFRAQIDPLNISCGCSDSKITINWNTNVYYHLWNRAQTNCFAVYGGQYRGSR